MNWKKAGLKATASFVSGFLKRNNIDTVLVGGSCVSLYTRNQYRSYDLDYVTYSTVEELEVVLKKIEYRRIGRTFRHKESPFILDFPAPPVSIGKEAPVERFAAIQTRLGTIIMLRPEDSVKDRLAAFFYWNDTQSLRQAILVTRSANPDLAEVKAWAEKEGEKEKYEYFLKNLKTKR